MSEYKLDPGGTYLYDWPTIRQMVLMMQADQGQLMAKMREILTRYEGDYVIPMVDLENEPKMPNLAPALVGEAVDQIALRAASTEPTIVCPPIEFSKHRGKGSREFATKRADALRATLEVSRWKLSRRRFYRHLTAYHTGSICVVPNFKDKMPQIQVRDPLCSYVEPQAAESVRDPAYVAFVNQYSGKYLRYYYPELKSELGGPITQFEDTRLWQILEWYDCECTVWGLLGPVDLSGIHINPTMREYTPMQRGANGYFGMQASEANREIARFPNRLGFPPAVMPHNVSLGRIASRIGSMLGNIDLQTKMMALFVVAQEKAVFPDTYIIGEGPAEPTLTSGDWKDGRTGDVNTVKNASAVGVLRSSPDPMTGQMIDRLERNFRSSTQLLPQFGGETYGALRTGRGIDALSGMALDPRIQELHEISEAYLPVMNKAILATYKQHWGSRSYSMYCGRASSRRLVEFTPAEHFETYENAVSYYMAGGDLMQVTQVLGSLFGADIISQRTMQEQHPFVGNADDESAQIRKEKLERAILEGLQQQVVAGAIPPTVLAMVLEELDEGTELSKVIQNVDKKLRELQATPAEPPPPGMIAPPAAMPGITGGPAADQQPVPQSPIATPQGVAAMRELMQQMGAR